MKRILNIHSVLCGMIATLCCFNVYATTLTPAEEKIVAAANQQQTAQLALLKKLVQINSGTNNVAGVKAVGAIVENELQGLGFHTSWVDEPSSMHKAPTLIAKRAGTGKRILLIAHLDTVFLKDSTFQHYQTIDVTTATGPGILDDKGGLVVLLYALKAMQTADVLNDTNLTVVMTGDEEESGKPTSISRKPLMDLASEQDIALDFEPSELLNTATIGRRGISNWQITTNGKQNHSATIFQNDVGDGAVFELARILNTFRRKLSHLQDITFNPGFILGGTNVNYDPSANKGDAFGKQNVIAKTAFAIGDLRYLTLKQKDTTKTKMMAIVKASLPGTHAQIHFVDGIPPMQPTENNQALLQKFSEVSIALGGRRVTAYNPALRGAGDISYVAASVPANLAGLGPIGANTHSTTETANLDSFPIQTKRAAILLYRLTHNK